MFESMSLAPYTYLLPYIAAVVYVYFFPAFLALLFNPAQAGAIAFTNLLIGWSVAGWVGCIVWVFDN